jgi:hypothetical protein
MLFYKQKNNKNQSENLINYKEINVNFLYKVSETG